MQDGFSWDAGAGVSYAWQSLGSIDVPAGHFERCFRRNAAGAPENFLVLCRGVGLVASTSVSENYRLELQSKNF